MPRFKLANVLLNIEDFLIENPGAFYRVEKGSVCTYDSSENELTISGLVDFTTYFNGVSIGKWQRYTSVNQIFLHVEIAGGPCTLAIRQLVATSENDISSDIASVIEVDAHDVFGCYDIAMPLHSVVAGFAIMADSAVRIRNAYYYANVEDEVIHPVCLALCTTTYRKEEFIIPNIERIKTGILGCDDPIADKFHVFVVDNGCSLDAACLSDGHISVIPNPNVGGSGGFARGMMAAQDSLREFTHVILMDDDVRMLVESFKRTFALLSLVTDEYSDACINGAMLELERPWLQYEDVAYVRSVGGYDRIKNDMRIVDADVIASNELINVEEVPNCRTYGAWWYSCIPMDQINRHGLPMPFFVRCDDVEYGTRMNTKYMTMNGICVWHARFAARFNAASSCYQYVRNMMITMALHDDFFNQRAFLVRFWNKFHHFLRTMDYDSASLWLDGMEDYLKGPEFLINADGEKLFREKNDLGERLVPIGEIDQSVKDQLNYKTEWLERREGYKTSTLKKALGMIPHDHHWFPDFILSDKPGVIGPGFESFSDWWTIAMRKRLVAISADEANAHVRVLDHERYKILSARFRILMLLYKREGASIAAEWRKKMPEMTSHVFWERYLEKCSGRTALEIDE